MAKKKEQAPPPEDDLMAGITMPDFTQLTQANARQPLGPPQGFYTEAAGAGVAQFADFVPFVNGDEWVPAYNLSPDDRDRLKARMNAAGLYGTSGYQSGSWTQEDANAYKTVLESANARGTRDENVVIDNIAEEVRKGPRVQGARAPLVSRVSDPTAVRNIIRQASLEMTGMRLSDEEEQRLISAYRSYQQGLNQAEYNAAAGGGTVAGDMGAEAFATSQIEATKTADVENVRAMNFMDKLMQSAITTQVPLTDTFRGQGMPQGGNEVV